MSRPLGPQHCVTFFARRTTLSKNADTTGLASAPFFSRPAFPLLPANRQTSMTPATRRAHPARRVTVLGISNFGTSTLSFIGRTAQGHRVCKFEEDGDRCCGGCAPKRQGHRKAQRKPRRHAVRRDSLALFFSEGQSFRRISGSAARAGIKKSSCIAVTETTAPA